MGLPLAFYIILVMLSQISFTFSKLHLLRYLSRISCSLISLESFPKELSMQRGATWLTFRHFMVLVPLSQYLRICFAGHLFLYNEDLLSYQDSFSAMLMGVGLAVKWNIFPITVSKCSIISFEEKVTKEKINKRTIYLQGAITSVAPTLQPD